MQDYGPTERAGKETYYFPYSKEKKEGLLLILTLGRLLPQPHTLVLLLPQALLNPPLVPAGVCG